MADEPTHVLRAEGVNFAATLYDTNDISTIRGAGLGLLEAMQCVETALGQQPGLSGVTRIFAGASQAAFSFRADEEAASAALEVVRDTLAGRTPGAPGRDAPPLAHLMFTCNIAPLAPNATAGVDATLRAAEALNRAGQFRAFTVKLPDPQGNSPGPDPLDHTSQGLKPLPLPNNETRVASPSVIERRKYGQSQRARFYVRADEQPLNVCQSLQEMIINPPRGLPVSARGKLAYLYADGNRFGAIRARLTTQIFAAELEQLQTRLLRRITKWLREGLACQDRCRMATIGTSGQARFETLAWGGDEFLFVMPAWLGMHFLGQVATAMKDWRICGQHLTFAFGMVICDVKAPVRQARDTAHKLAESVKNAMGDTLRSGAAIQAYESHNLIDAPLATQRSLLFGIPPREANHLDIALTINAEALAALPDTIRNLTDEGAREGALSGAMLHDAIAAARVAPGGLRSPGGKEAAQKILKEAFERFGQPVPGVTIPGFVERGLVLDLCLIAMLRDYCAVPEGGVFPDFPAVA